MGRLTPADVSFFYLVPFILVIVAMQLSFLFRVSSSSFLYHHNCTTHCTLIGSYEPVQQEPRLAHLESWIDRVCR